VLPETARRTSQFRKNHVVTTKLPGH